MCKSSKIPWQQQDSQYVQLAVVVTHGLREKTELGEPPKCVLIYSLISKMRQDQVKTQN